MCCLPDCFFLFRKSSGQNGKSTPLSICVDFFSGRGANSRRARVVKGMDSKPIVISRAGSSPAVDAMCRMAEV